MSIFTKSLTIGFTVLALCVAAEAQSNGGGGGGSGTGGAGESGIMKAAPAIGPISHATSHGRRRGKPVRVITIEPCSGSNAIMNRAVCQTRTN